MNAATSKRQTNSWLDHTNGADQWQVHHLAGFSIGLN